MPKTSQLNTINNLMKNTLMETLDIVFTDIGEDYLIAQMPVGSKVFQPMGILHGGATAALAESVGSTASHILINSNEYEVKGIEITANHIRSVSKGMLTAKANLIHKGRTLHLWEIRITNEEQKLISVCKLTNIVIKK